MATFPKKGVPARPAAAEPIPPAIAETPAELAAEISETFVEPVAEMQQSVRAALEKGVIDSRAAFAKARTSADEAASALELSFNAARHGVIALNAKALEAMRTNAEANFDFMKASFAAKSLSDLVALQSEFARKQVEAMTGQAKDIGALAQKTMQDTFEPITGQVAKSFKIAV
jgi:phasin